MSRKANKKSKKSFLFVEKVGNHGGVTIHFIEASELDERWLTTRW